MGMTWVSFVGGDRGDWQVERTVAVRGDTLPAAVAMERVESAATVAPPATAVWSLQGVRSNERYVERDVGAFDELLSRLRATEEWRYVEREVEVRLRRG